MAAATVGASTLTYVAIAASVASAAIGAYGASQAASAQSAALNYQAQVAQNNATIAKTLAQQETAAGDVQAENRLAAAGQQTAAVRAAAAASGVDPNVGTPVGLQSDTQKLGMLDALTIRNNAARRAYNYQVSGMSDVAQAQLDTMGASNAELEGQANVFKSIVGGASSVADKWSMYQLRAGGTGTNPGLLT